MGRRLIAPGAGRTGGCCERHIRPADRESGSAHQIDKIKNLCVEVQVANLAGSRDMAERIYIRGKGGGLEPLEEELFSTEDELQALIAEHPELLALGGRPTLVRHGMERRLEGVAP